MWGESWQKTLVLAGVSVGTAGLAWYLFRKRIDDDENGSRVIRKSSDDTEAECLRDQNSCNIKDVGGSFVDLCGISNPRERTTSLGIVDPKIATVFPEIETNQQFQRYREAYQSFRLTKDAKGEWLYQHARGAKGEVSKLGELPTVPSFGSVLGITGSDSLAEELDSALAILRDYRVAYRSHRERQPRRGAAGQVEDLAKILSKNDCRLLPVVQSFQFKKMLCQWKEALAKKDLSDVAGRRLHLHVGAGRLGLGLVLPAIVKSGRPYAIVQRPSPTWAEALQAGRAEVRLNESMLAELMVVRNLRDVQEALDSEQKAMLVLSDNEEVLCQLVGRASSYSCSIGGKDLTDALEPIIKAVRFLDKVGLGSFSSECGRPVLSLYACENDHGAVERLAEEIGGLLEVVPVLVDRVCTARDIGKGGVVNISTEEYEGELVLTPPIQLDHIRPVPFGGHNVRQPLTAAGAAFLHQKKILSVNGTHTTIAFLTLIAAHDPKHRGPPLGDHELLVYDIEAETGVGRKVWVWVVARQLMLLWEFTGAVVKDSLSIEPPDDYGVDHGSDTTLVNDLLSSARTAARRLSKGGDKTSRVLGGGVENRWQTRLSNVQVFLENNKTLSPIQVELLKKANISEQELREEVSELVKDSKRFTLLQERVTKQRSPSPHFSLLRRVPDEKLSCSPKPSERSWDRRLQATPQTKRQVSEPSPDLKKTPVSLVFEEGLTHATKNGQDIFAELCDDGKLYWNDGNIWAKPQVPPMNF